MVPYCSCCLCLYFGSSIMLVTYFVNFRLLNDHLFGKELFILFAASAFRKLSSIYVFSYFPFGFEGGIWDLIVSVPDHCLSFYFPQQVTVAWCHSNLKIHLVLNEQLFNALKAIDTLVSCTIKVYHHRISTYTGYGD